jgi:antitoxin component of RelBE/YafQ-DinJ toxin-antitoxin module
VPTLEDFPQAINLFLKPVVADIAIPFVYTHLVPSVVENVAMSINNLPSALY